VYASNKCRLCVQILDLLVSFAIAAAKSRRRKAIFGPFPHIMDPAISDCAGQHAAALDPSKPDWKLLLSALKRIPKVAELASHNKNGMSERVKDFIERRGKGRLGHDLALWILGTNRARLSMLVDGSNGGPLKCVATPFQYVVEAESEEKEIAFQRRVKEAGSKTFQAWHGSPAENWHSIIRGGLKVKLKVYVLLQSF
jgi:hypothetical protein